MESASGKMEVPKNRCKTRRKVIDMSSAAICLSIASLVLTILCCTALFFLWSKYEAAIFELENKVKKCQQPLGMVDSLSRNGNSDTEMLMLLNWRLEYLPLAYLFIKSFVLRN